MDKNFKPRRRVIKIPKNAIFIGLGVCFVVIGVFIGRQFTWKNVAADQVAVVVNNLTGRIKAVTRAGAVLYYPFIQDIYILDRPEQVLMMTSSNISKKYPRGNPVVVRSKDGGEVALDITIQYRIVPEMANEIIQDSGPADAYKIKWLNDYGRTVCRYTFGELTIDEFPQSSKRDEKAYGAMNEINEMLNNYGIMVSSVNVLDYRYYREYAEKIQERRLAEKEIEEQKAMTEASKRNKEKVVIEETKKMEVEIARFKGELDKRILEAEGSAARIRNDAETYLLKTKIDADAEYERLANEAKGIFAQKKAEAEGIFELRKALEGPGALNLVKMEYAKRLKDARFSGTPVLRAGQEEQVRLMERLTTTENEVELRKEEPGKEVPAFPFTEESRLEELKMKE